MNYIIMDLEWNNTYCKKKKGFMNEIIEIGAVKLNSNLDIIDTYSIFVLSLKITFFNDEQLLNSSPANCVTPLGIIISSNAIQSSKAL